MLGADAKKERNIAIENMKAEGADTQVMDAADLAVTPQQAALFSKLQSGDADTEDLARKGGTQLALLDFQERTLGAMSEQTVNVDGEDIAMDEFIASKAGVDAEELEAFKDRGKEIARLRATKDKTEEEVNELNTLTEQQFETYQKLQGRMGAGTQGRGQFADDLEAEGVVLNARARTNEDLEKEQAESLVQLEKAEADGDTEAVERLTKERADRQELLEDKDSFKGSELELIQNEAGDASELLQDKMEFNRNEATVKGKTFTRLRELAGDSVTIEDLEQQIEDAGSDEEKERLTREKDILEGLEVGQTESGLQKGIDDLNVKIEEETDPDKKAELIEQRTAKDDA
jgi:hypothetical protein